MQTNKQERKSSRVHRVLPCPTIEAHVCRWWSPQSCSGQRGGALGASPRSPRAQPLLRAVLSPPLGMRLAPVTGE